MRNAEKELAEIKSMMERSTRFLSLSGLSGVLAGVYALLGAALAFYWIYIPNGSPESTNLPNSLLLNLMIVGLVVMLLAVGTAWLFSQKKSKRISQKIWTPSGKRFILSLFIPVAVGGLFCVALIFHEYFLLIVPATLVFYGLGLVNASQFTLSEIKYLGYCQLLLGLISAFLTDYGLIIWVLGFGVMHIIYGTLMHLKYDR